jgi:hypothetical protein
MTAQEARARPSRPRLPESKETPGDNKKLIDDNAHDRKYNKSHRDRQGRACQGPAPSAPCMSPPPLAVRVSPRWRGGFCRGVRRPGALTSDKPLCQRVCARRAEMQDRVFGMQRPGLDQDHHRLVRQGHAAPATGLHGLGHRVRDHSRHQPRFARWESSPIPTAPPYRPAPRGPAIMGRSPARVSALIRPGGASSPSPPGRRDGHDPALVIISLASSSAQPHATRSTSRHAASWRLCSKLDNTAPAGCLPPSFLRFC